MSEYLPWYRKRAHEIEGWISQDDWIHGETAGYLRHCYETRNLFETDFAQSMKEDSPQYGSDGVRSVEHESYILEALETGKIYRGHFNVINNHAITNLPDDAVVELPCYADKYGIHVSQYGDLPDGPAAICISNISVQRLAVKAAVFGDDFQLRQAMLLDPLVGAVCNSNEVWQMCDEMLIAGKKWLPQYQSAIKVAEKRLKTEKLIPRKEYRGAVRLREKSIDELRSGKLSMQN